MTHCPRQFSLPARGCTWWSRALSSVPGKEGLCSVAAPPIHWLVLVYVALHGSPVTCFKTIILKWALRITIGRRKAWRKKTKVGPSFKQVCLRPGVFCWATLKNWHLPLSVSASSCNSRCFGISPLQWLQESGVRSSFWDKEIMAASKVPSQSQVHKCLQVTSTEWVWRSRNKD